MVTMVKEELKRPRPPGARDLYKVRGEYNVRSLSATGDSVTDDTAAIQAMVTAFTRTSTGLGYGGGGLAGPGTYRITDTIVLDNLSGFSLLGSARGQVTFLWDGPSDRPMFRVTNCREATFANFRVNVATGKTLLSAFDQYHATASGVWTAKNIQYRNILLDGTIGGASSRLLNGWRSGLASGAVDTNNDFTHWDNCSVVNYGTAAWYLWGSQNYGNRFVMCRAGAGQDTTNRGQYAVYADVRAGFVWEGGDVSYNGGADFYAQATGLSSPIVIRDAVSESSDRFLDILQGQSGHVLVENCRVAGDQVNADGETIRAQAYHGHLIVRNTNLLERHATRRLRARYAISVTARRPGFSFVWEDNTLIQNQTSRPGTAPALDSGFFSSLQPTRMAGNKVLDETNVVASQWLGKSEGVWTVRANGGDDTASLQAAHDLAAPGETIYLPDANYTISTLAITKAIKVRGAGWRSATKAVFGTAAWLTLTNHGGTVLRSTATSGAAISCDLHWGKFDFADLMILGPGSGTSTGLLLGTASHAPLQCEIRNLMIANFSVGAALVFVEESAFYDLHLIGNDTNLTLESATNQNVFVNTDCQYSTADGILLKSAGAACDKFLGGLLQNCTGRSALRVEAGCEVNAFEGFWVENNATCTNALDFAGGSGTVYRDSWHASNGGPITIASGALTFGPCRAGSTPALTITATATGTIIDQSSQFVVTDSGAGTIRRSASGLAVGSGGSFVKGIFYASAALDFGSIAAGAHAELPITVTGAKVTGGVAAGGPVGTLESGLSWSVRTSADNTVQVRLLNATGSAIDPASRTYQVSVTNFV